ncbi:MbcA/ParS/Xre antitoxin family protein [Bradyrhizobium sp. WSM3983]|uniref:MbcA/ParS/Xre antitoxin family protein n=1 Tax=Bradyrhizobium sp. WSM3983 TaxID=1038867 RepID=UPI000408357C|nr:MbcA/ParS/Xre antitoxin family protein [Bradyrhizobium sp. WSM3983]
MNAEPLAEVFEELKQLRRLGGRRDAHAHPGITSSLEDAYALLVKAGQNDTAELIRRVIDGLSPLEKSGSLVRILEIRTLANRVFGDMAKAAAWLDRPNRSLSGQKPVDLLQDELGAAVVRELLEQIDHGIFA